MTTHQADILVAHDSPVAREGLRRVLGSVPGWRIVGEAATVEVVVPLTHQLAPDVIILDMKWGADGELGLSLIGRLKNEDADLRIVAVSAHDHLLASAASRGADATLSFDLPQTDILAAIDRVLKSTADRSALAKGLVHHWDSRITKTVWSFLEAHCQRELTNLTAEGFELLTSGIPKVEAIERVSPRSVLPTTDAFEIFRIGRDGARYRNLQERARQIGVPQSLLSATSLIVCLEGTALLRDEARCLGLAVDRLEFNINLDLPAIAARLAAPALERYPDVRSILSLEVHEAVKGRAIVALEELLESFEVAVILDDVDRLDSGVRRRLHKWVTKSKIDFKTFQSMAKDLARHGEGVVSQLLAAAWDKPLIVEGLAQQAQFDFLRSRWPKAAPDLFVQGHLIHPRSPWPSILESLRDLGHTSGYTVR